MGRKQKRLPAAAVTPLCGLWEVHRFEAEMFGDQNSLIHGLFFQLRMFTSIDVFPDLAVVVVEVELRVRLSVKIF